MPSKQVKPRKTHPQAKLMNLPDEQREAIWAQGRAGMPLQQIADWILREYSITCSKYCVSRFLAWFKWERQSMRFSEDKTELRRILKQANIKDLDESSLDSYATVFFKVLALGDMDSQTFLSFYIQKKKLELEELRYQQKNREIALQEKKFKEAVKRNDKATEITESEMSEEEKLAKLKELFRGT